MRGMGRNLNPERVKSGFALAGTVRRLAARLGLTVLVLASAVAARAEPGWVDLGQARVRLIAGLATDTRPHRIGLQIRLAPSWATYWRSPGAAGVAPSFDWSGSANLARAEVLWPVPERLDEGGSETFGYTEEVVLPVEIAPVRADAPVALKLRFDFAVCGRICVPKHADLSLPAATGGDSEQAALLRRFLDRVPRPSRPDLKIARLDFTADALNVALNADLPLAPGARLDLIAEGPDDALTARPETRLDPSGRHAALTLRPRPGEPWPDRLSLTLIAGDRALSAVAERRGAD